MKNENRGIVAGLWMPLSVAALGVLCYIGSLHGEFVWDDLKLIVSDLGNGQRRVSEVLFSDLWGQSGGWSNYYRPLPSLVFGLLHSVFGLRPEPFHALNIALHAGASCLVFLLVRTLLDAGPEETTTSAPGAAALPAATSSWLAYAAAVVFAAHPVHTEAVAWISGVMDLSCAFFSLLALLLHATARSGHRASASELASLGSLLLALASKEPAAVVPFLFVAFDLLYNRRELIGITSAVRRWLPAFLVLAVYLGLRYYALRGFLPFAQQDGTTAADMVLRTLQFFALYVQTLIWPLNLKAVHDIPAPAVSASLLRTAMLVVGGLAVAAWMAVRSGRAAVFGLLIFLGTLAPAFMLPALRQTASLGFAERYLYLPSAGAAVLLAVALGRLGRLGRTPTVAAWGALVVVVTTFSALTVARTQVWTSGFALWSDCVRTSPGVAFVHFNFGLALEGRGRVSDAIREYRVALALDADNVDAHNNLGILLAQADRLDEAIMHFESAARVRPGDAEVRLNLARAYDLTGRTREADVQRNLAARAARSTQR